MIKSAKYGDKVWVINFDKAILCQVIRTYAARENRVKLKVIHEGITGSLHAKFEDCFRTKLKALMHRLKQAERAMYESGRYVDRCRSEMFREKKRIYVNGRR